MIVQTRRDLRKEADDAVAGTKTGRLAHRWHSSALRELAQAAAAVGLRMAAAQPKGRESLRAEARRTQQPGETFYSALSRVRGQRAAAEGLPPSVGQGHPRRGEPGLRELHAQRAWGASWFVRGADGSGRVINRDVSRLDAQRAGRYMSLTRELAKGRVLPGEFERRVKRMARIDGTRPLSDPVLVLLLVRDERERRRRGEGQIVFESGKSAIRRARELLGLPPESPAPTRREQRPTPTRAPTGRASRPRAGKLPPPIPLEFGLRDLSQGLRELSRGVEELVRAEDEVLEAAITELERARDAAQAALDRLLAERGRRRT